MILAVHHHAARTANVVDVAIATPAHVSMTTLVIRMKVAVPNVLVILSVPRIVLAYATNAPILAQALVVLRRSAPSTTTYQFAHALLATVAMLSSNAHLL